MTIEEAIWKEEALAYSFGERYKRLGEPVGDLAELEAEHNQYADWLKELKAYQKAHEEIQHEPLAWEYGQAIEKCLWIIDNCLKEVKSDEYI